MPVHAAALLVFAAVAAALGGCARNGPVAAGTDTPGEASPPGFVRLDADATTFSLVDTTPAEEVTMYDGFTGEPVTGRDLVARLAASDAVLIGEVHDDPLAGRLHLRIAQAVLPGPGGTGALTLEALERGRPMEDTLRNWPQDGATYRPVIAHARGVGVPVVHANATRQDAVRARVEGLQALADAPFAGRLFVLPTDDERVALEPYRRRFDAVFERLHEAHGSSPDGSAEQDARSGVSAADFFNAQLVWDATMADSVARARATHGGPVVHVNGGFHSDFEGGVTTLLRRRGLGVTTISLLPVDAARLREEDIGRANVVIYTGGGRPQPPAPPRLVTPQVFPGRPAAATTRPATTRPDTRPTMRPR